VGWAWAGFFRPEITEIFSAWPEPGPTRKMLTSNWHASDSATCVKPAFFGLLCAWREVLILRQHTFWHAQWDILVDQDV
jgi:hypothetical protein